MIPARELDETAPGVWAVSALVISSVADGGLVARRLSGLGARVVVMPNLRDALNEVERQRHRMSLMIIDCDHAGGVETGQQAFDRLMLARSQFPVILVSSDCPEQTFPVTPTAPFLLRAPLSALALRLAFDVAFATFVDTSGFGKGRNQIGAPLSK